MKVFNSKVKAVNHLLTLDTFTLGKNTTKEYYTKALNILLEKSKVRKDLEFEKIKGCVYYKKYEKYNIMYQITHHRIRMFNDIKDVVSWYNDKELQTAIDKIIKAYKLEREER